MDINTGINPQSFGFDRSFFEAAGKMGDEDRLRFYDSLCEVAFNRRMPDGADGDSALSVALTLALPMVEQSCCKVAAGMRGGRPRKA